MQTPLLSFCHLAAALRAAGHEVALLDASAPRAPHDHDAIAARVAAFAPDLVGLHLKTLHVQPAYALAAELAAAFTLVAGGPTPRSSPTSRSPTASPGSSAARARTRWSSSPRSSTAGGRRPRSPGCRGAIAAWSATTPTARS
ncbi:MAG: cobalamin B12-binding domain-containing protein [Kofleriaceae bacterium]|nr:cobalamin B12-binding domain-containing protein [Kofleriaceae bacterium]